MVDYFIVAISGDAKFTGALRKQLPVMPRLRVVALHPPNGYAALAGKHPHIVLVQGGTPPQSHIGLLQLSPLPAIFILDAQGDPRSAVSWLKAGASDYFVMETDHDRFAKSLGQRYEDWVKSLEKNRSLVISSRNDGPIGHEDNVKKIKQVITKAGRLKDLTVLLQGETGTGKGFIARRIHACSRLKGEMVEINCAAIPDQLLEAELFGYEAGAFTGANHRKQGLLELAQDGTLLFDEIESLPLDLQAKLLKFIEEKRFRRIGGSKQLEFEGRIIACTNEDLKVMVEQGTFRRDLFYRLNIFPILLSPLRDKTEDIPLLTDYFIKIFADRYQLPVTEITSSALDLLLTYPWPGNIRELKHAVERAVIVREEGILQRDDFDLHGKSVTMASATHSFSITIDAQGFKLANAERMIIRQALLQTGGNRSTAAKLLGIPRGRLLRRIVRYGLESEGKPQVNSNIGTES